MATTFDLGRAAGSRLLNTVGVPSPSLGDYWDWAMDTDSGNVYEKTGDNLWTYRGCLKGIKGDTGAVGPVGPQGQPGRDGAILDLNTGVFAMTLGGDGHLLVQVNVAEAAPPMRIDTASGHLFYEISEGG